MDLPLPNLQTPETALGALRLHSEHRLWQRIPRWDEHVFRHRHSITVAAKGRERNTAEPDMTWSIPKEAIRAKAVKVALSKGHTLS